MVYRILFLIICLWPLSATAQSRTILIIGDSISAAYGIPVEKGWVSLLEQRLVRQDYDYKVFNASISGETTMGAKMRLQNLLDTHQPQLVVIELGGNDGLRGFTLKQIETNFIEMVTMVKQQDSDVLLVPMRIPPNYGAAYSNGFESIYKDVSKMTDVKVTKFILHGIAENLDLMQADGIHPVASAQAKMLDNVWPSLKELLTIN